MGVLLLFRKLSTYCAVLVLAFICLVSFSLMLWGALTDAAITDELAHIPAGYGYVHNFDYRLNPEHPPLVKVIAALPLLFLNPRFPTENSAWTEDANGQWTMGNKFLYESGNDANQIIRYARIGPILLTILLIILIYAWSRELLGGWWALLPAFLFALSPTVLAHGHYVTTDIGAALGVLLATYYFIKFLHSPSRRNLIYAGLSFGIAEITKFSTVLLVPYFGILMMVFYLASVMRDWSSETAARFRRFFVRGSRYLKSLVIIFALGYILVVYPIYFLFTIHYPTAKQATDTEFILTSFAGGPTVAGATCQATRCLADLNIWMAKHSLTRPFAEYMLGILMVLQRSAAGNTSYFLGEVSANGSHWYFPVVYLLKEPLPVIIMTLFALAYCLREISKRIMGRWSRVRGHILNYLGVNFTEFSMFVFIAIYWAWSIRSPLNIGFRHLLPTMPFIYILTTGAWKRWVTTIDMPQNDSMIGLLKAGVRTMIKISTKYLFLILLLLWFFVETVFAAPYFLSYFNELGGGLSGGYRYVTDSNYDWGQDLIRLQNFVIAHSEIDPVRSSPPQGPSGARLRAGETSNGVDKIAVDYFGGGSPKYYLESPSIKLGATLTVPSRAKVENWWSARGNPSADSTGSPQAGSGQVQPIHWLAVSINTLQGAIQPLASGQQRKPEDEYGWLTALRPRTQELGSLPRPDYRAGTSIFIYKL